MTNDELERMMTFIVEAQARTAAQQAANAEQLAQSEALINALIERQERTTKQQAATAERMAVSEALINALAQRQLEMGEQLDDHDERIARFERSYTAISNLLQKHDTHLVALTDGHNNLVELQERTAQQQSATAEQLAQAEAIINALALRQMDGTKKLDDLIAIVNRYITARGNGGSREA